MSDIWTDTWLDSWTEESVEPPQELLDIEFTLLPNTLGPLSLVPNKLNPSFSVLSTNKNQFGVIGSSLKSSKIYNDNRLGLVVSSPNLYRSKLWQ